MFSTVDFETCIRDNLKARRFGKERGDKIVDDFRARAEYHLSVGEDALRANELAMKDVFDNLSFEAAERTKRTAKMLSIAARNIERAEFGVKSVTASGWLGDGGSGPGVGAVVAIKALIEPDPRVPGENYVTRRASVFGQLMTTWTDTLDKISKGAFGVQKGKAHLDNFVREFLDGPTTGDAAAQELAQSWAKISDLIPEMMNYVGGSMRRLDRFLPQRQNPARLVGRETDWVRQHMDWLDWSRMRWPDGTTIALADRQKVLQFAVESISTDGANKIDPMAFRGRGRAVGNMMEQHRFLHYKDGNAWLAAHNEYGDGNVFDVLIGHIEDMSHRIALVDVFGPNPDAGFANAEAAARKAAAGLSGKERAKADAVLKNKVKPMYETIARKNPMDPHNVPGAVVTGASQMAVAAQLGSATLLAAPGDWATSAMAKFANGINLFGGVNTYFKALMSDQALARSISRQSGFIMDDVVTSVYNTQRFTGVATWAPAVTKRVSDVVLRASLLSGHTRAARWSGQMEMMGALSRDAGTKFADVKFKRMLERFGITAADWDNFRALTPHTPRDGVSFLRPTDFLQTKLANKNELYEKFHRLVYTTSREMVPDATVEASVMLRGTTRPDTLSGMILHSFSMYKNFPVTFWMTYGRLGLASADNVGGRVGFYAGLIASMTMVGAIGVQMREVAKGREPMPIDTLPAFAQFFGKSFLAGGALSIWGDFLFTGVNEYGKGPQDVIGGPVASMLGDITDFALGDALEYVQSGDADFSPMLKKGASLLERYTPGSSIWYARLALERAVWDRLDELSDPDAYRKRRRAMEKQKNDFGNEYYLPPNT